MTAIPTSGSGGSQPIQEPSGTSSFPEPTPEQQTEYDNLTAEASSLINQLQSDKQEEYNTQLDADKVDFTTDPARGIEELVNLVKAIQALVPTTEPTAYQQSEFDNLTEEATSLISQLPSDKQEEYNNELVKGRIMFQLDPARGIEALENLVNDLQA